MSQIIIPQQYHCLREKSAPLFVMEFPGVGLEQYKYHELELKEWQQVPSSRYISVGG